MPTNPLFPTELLLDEPDRNTTLLREFYEQHHERRNYAKAQHENTKAAMFREYLEAKLNEPGFVGVDLGCRGGALTSKLGVIQWVGVDVDGKAVERANAVGIPSLEMNIAIWHRIGERRLQRGGHDRSDGTPRLSRHHRAGSAQDPEEVGVQRLLRIRAHRLSFVQTLEGSPRQEAFRGPYPHPPLLVHRVGPLAALLFPQCGLQAVAWNSFPLSEAPLALQHVRDGHRHR